MNGTNLPDDYYEKPDQSYIDQELKKIDKLVCSFCALMKIDSQKIETNVLALKEIIIRLDKRKLYFHIFHKGMEANDYKKNAGLFVFWVLKLHPFWMHIDEDYTSEQIEFATYINEKICLFVVMALLREYNSDFIERGEDLLASYKQELEYSFRFRDMSKEALFLMFDPFYYLYFFNKSISKDQKVIV